MTSIFDNLFSILSHVAIFVDIRALSGLRQFRDLRPELEAPVGAVHCKVKENGQY